MENPFGALGNQQRRKLSAYLSIFIVICFFVALPVFSVDAAWNIKEEITSGLIGWIYTAVYEIMKIVLNFASLLVYFAAWLVDVMLNPSLYRAILTDPTTTTGGVVTEGAVTVGWRTVRDFCNMFYVFFLLLIAFGTIVGSGTYNYKSLLPKFVVSLFLINFSKIITLIVIDVGQVFLFGMAAWLGTFSGSEGSGAALSGIVNAFKMTFANVEEPTFADIMTIIFAVVYTFVLAIIYLILAAFLLFRLVMFVVLVIVSPFAFFSMVLPSMRPYTSKWKGMLFSNAISGPVFVFFVYLSAMMAKTLTENPITNSSTTTSATSTDVSTLGDISKMQYMEPFLAMIIPHVVAMSLLLFSVQAATMVGAYGSKYIVGGRFGIGRMAGMAYSVPKLGERAARRTASRAAHGAASAGRWAWGTGVRNFASVANANDQLHGAYQGVVGSIGGRSRYTVGTATGIIAKDMAAQEAAKEKMVGDRLKKYGGNLKALDVELLLKGDNVDKALAMQAAATQGKLNNPALQAHFSDAESVMPRSAIKDVTSKSLAFSVLTNENQAKISRGDTSSFDADALERINASQKLGFSQQKAIEDEIKREKFMGLVADGEDSKLQDIDNEDTARVIMNSYTTTQFNDAIKKMNKTRKAKFSSGIERVQSTMKSNLARAEQEEITEPDPNRRTMDRSKIESEYTKGAFAAIKTGSKLEGSIATRKTDADYNDKVNSIMGQIDAPTIGSMDMADLKEEGWRLDEEKIKSVAEKKDRASLGNIKTSLLTRKNTLVNSGVNNQHPDMINNDNRLDTVNSKLN